MLCDETLSELESLMEEDFTKLLTSFFIDSEKRLDTIESLYRADDIDALKNSAHSFKGSLANLGALDMVIDCELLRQTNNAQDTQRYLQQLAAHWQDVRQELTRRYLA